MVVLFSLHLSKSLHFSKSLKNEKILEQIHCLLGFMKDENINLGSMAL
jgi:hypothetical protein